MNIPSPIFVGYFPKITAKKSDLKTEKGDIWLKNETVEEICSVSDCISEGPEEWIDKWKHNDLGFYDTEEAALSVIPENSLEKFELFGYKLYPVEFNQGKIVKHAIKSKAVENLSLYVFIGFDIVSRSGPNFFECSPLSCNSGCEIFAVNRFCLIQDFEEALQCCRKISEEIAGVESVKRPDGIFEYDGKWEPGPYYLFQIFRKKK
jgi:hypothetical protein